LAAGIVICNASLLAQRNRLSATIDDNQRVSLAGHVHPSARPEFDLGRVGSSMVLQSLTLELKPSGSQPTELNQLLAAQQDPSSADYHRWLTPEQYADRFGASLDDVNKIAAWLQQQGFQVTNIARGRNWISFSGTAVQVEAAFRTELHRYQVNGETHFANAFEPSVPLALQVLVRGVRGLHDFRMKPLLKPRSTPGADSEQPSFTSTTSGNHFLSPDDFATIYNLKPLYSAGIDGTGQKLVVAGQTQINLSDIEQFRSRFNLPTNDPQVILVPNKQDPGLSSSDLPEADLDLEWSGAVAPNASITFVYSNDVMDAVQYAIDQNLAPVVTISYGLCETETPSSDSSTFQSWARQGNAQGITWFAASGDSGGADCVVGSSTTDGGPSVDVPGSIPEVTSVGGTEFNEGSGQFWDANNNANSGSALGYIPEMVWNDSVPRNPSAGGGGASVVFLQPSWQKGAGVPNNNARNVPDVSLSASADHDGYMVYSGGKLQVYGGTSVSAPSFAGIATLLNHYLVATGAQTGPGLGNANPKLYGLAQTAPSVFHDIVVGNNIVTVACGARARNCTSGSYGFNAAPGYDQASGLGSVDTHNLVLAWSSPNGSIVRSTPVMKISASANSVLSSDSVMVTATVASANGGTPSGVVTFSLGAAALGSAALSGSSGAATASLTISAAQLPLGASQITAAYAGDNSYSGATASVTISVNSPSSGVSIFNLVNYASYRQSYAPGMMLSIFGSGLAPSTLFAATVPLPLQLAGVTVTINGIPAPIFDVDPGGVDVQIPFEVPANTPATVVVNNNGTSATSSLTTSAAAPGIFTDQNGALVPAGSASGNQVVTLYITGQGAVTPSIPTGSAPAEGTNLPVPTQTVSVSVGSAPAITKFIGIPAGFVAATQIDFQVPSGLALGPQPVVVTVGGVASPPATLSIQP
jgi:uncharacterized protein (TIGR03437 family)